MITEFIGAAMRKAKYEYLENDRIYFGKIPGCKGLWASGKTKDECEVELRECLDEWIVLSLRLNMPIPVIGGINMNNHPFTR